MWVRRKRRCYELRGRRGGRGWFSLDGVFGKGKCCLGNRLSLVEFGFFCIFGFFFWSFFSVGMVVRYCGESVCSFGVVGFG